MVQSKRKVAGLIKLEQGKGQELARMHPEIADLYKGPSGNPDQGLTYREIARRVMPDSHVETGACIVRYAMKHLLSKKELTHYGRLHKPRALTPEVRRRAAANQPIEVRVEGGKENIRRRGFTPWANDELSDVFGMMANPDYVTPKGLDNKRMGKELDERYHEGEGVRDAESVSRLVCRIRVDKQKYLNRLVEQTV